MKKLTFWKSLFLLCALIVGSTSAWGQTAVVGTELWKESFKGSPSSSTTFTATSSWNNYLNKTTFVASDANSLTYSTNNAMANSGTAANMDGAHVWLNKNTTGYIQVVGIKLYNASKVKVSWAQSSNTTVKVAYAFDGGTTYTDLSSNGSASDNFESDVLDVTDHTTINLKFYRTSTKTNVRLDNLTLTATKVADNTKVATPEITGALNFLESTTVGISCDTDDATIQYSTDNGTTWNYYSGEFNLTATTTVKAKATKSGLTDSDESSATFTKRTPVTVTEALTAIAALDNNGTSADQCVRGIVSTAGSLSSGKINYYISTDGTTANQLYIFGGKGLNNANFTASADIKVGDEVVVFGNYKKYVSGNTTTPEVTDGYLLSITKKTAPTFTLDKAEVELTMGNTETADVALTTNTDGTITCESDDEDVATVALKSDGVYTITAKTAGTATITLKSALSATNYPASATVAVTVTDNRAAAGISFANTSVTKTWGESFMGQELTNTNNLNVTWASTNEAVATVNEEGSVSILKAGTTSIKATFAGDATYKAAVASYTLTVNKAEAGLSYATTNYNVELFDNSFIAPVLTNPNGLTVTYTSDKVAVAEVNENTGAVTLHTNAAGEAKLLGRQCKLHNYRYRSF